MSCIAHPPTSHPTPTSSPCSWLGWAGRGTSSRTTCWSCWGRSLARLLRQLTSQPANELLINETDSSLKQTAYWTTAPTGQLAEGKSVNYAKKAAVRYVCDNLCGMHSSDKQRKQGANLSSTGDVCWKTCWLHFISFCVSQAYNGDGNVFYFFSFCVFERMTLLWIMFQCFWAILLLLTLIFKKRVYGAPHSVLVTVWDVSVPQGIERLVVAHPSGR